MYTSLSSITLTDNWWVSPSTQDAIHAAEHPDFSPDSLEFAKEPDNHPHSISLADAVHGLTPRFGWRDLPEAETEILPPQTDFIHGGAQESIEKRRRVPTPFLTYAREFQVPDSWADKSLFLTLDNTRYHVTVSLNRRKVTHYVGGLEPHRLDVTDFLVPGKNNLLVITVGDSGTSGHRVFDAHSYTGTRLPTCKEIENNLVHPVVYGGSDRGVGSVKFEALNKVRTDFVFAAPKVRLGLLRYAVTLRNDSEANVEVHVRSEAAGAKVLMDEVVGIPAHGSKTISKEIPWKDAVLWDTDQPHLYALETTLSREGEIIDFHRDSFGFREFTINGHSFYLNGKKIHLFGQSGHTSADHDATLSLEEKMRILSDWKIRGNVNHIRLHAKPQDRGWVEAADRVGMLITTETALWTTGFHSFDWAGAEEACYENVRNHFLEALVRRDRNNPSVIIWSLSNEMSPIIPADLEQPKMAAMTRVFERIIAEAEQEDDSRVIQMSSAMDFVGRLKVYNLHYPKNWQAFPDYPHTAYWLDSSFLFPWYGPKRFEMPSWGWRKDKPLIFGEFTCVFGATPDNQASIVGDVAFEQSDFGSALVNEKLWPLEINAYRRLDVSGFTAWSCMVFSGYEESAKTLELPHVRAHAHALRPLAVICHTYRTRWFAGEEVALELSIHNDTRHDVALELRCEILDGDRVLWKESLPVAEYATAESRAFTSRYRAPQKAASLRYRATLFSGGNEVDRWERQVEITDRLVVEPFPVGSGFYDADGALQSLLSERGIAGVQLLHDLLQPGALDGVERLWVNFAQAKLHAREWRRVFPQLSKFVEEGGTVILDQPPEYCWQDLPVKLKNGKGYAPEERLEITYAYIVAPHHPAMRGLSNQDFSLWGADYYVARRCFEVPQEGNALPLLVAGTDRAGLTSSPLLEFASGKGRWVVTSLEIVSKLGQEPQAVDLMRNLLLPASTQEKVCQAGVSVQSETLRILREVGFGGQNVSASNALEKAVCLVDGADFEPELRLAQVRDSLAAGNRVCLHDLGVEKTRSVLEFLELPGTVVSGKAEEREFDTFVHSHNLSDGMTNSYLYWIVNKSKVAPWTLAPLHPEPASALILLPKETPNAWSITRRGAVVLYQVGKGRLILDNLRWQDPGFDEPERPRRYVMTLLTNLGILLSEGSAKRLSEEFETEAEKRERGHF